MSRRFRPALARAAILGVALLALLAPGCAKKLPSDPTAWELAAYPEGTRDSLDRTPSDLIVWPDVPMRTLSGLRFSDIKFETSIRRTGIGAMQGLIVDYVQAGRYQAYRGEPGGGFRRFADFELSATKRWADRSHYGGPQGTVVLPPAQLFAFADRGPSTLDPKTYVGRAVIAGLSSARSPLTNLGATRDTSAIANLLYTGSSTPSDSLIDLSWQAVPGAASYWVHIFQKRGDIRFVSEVTEIGLPSPIAQGRVRDLFVGRFPASVTSYKLGNPPPPGSRILFYRVLRTEIEVLIRVSAVDAQGRMIAMTTGLEGVGPFGNRDSIQIEINSELGYLFYPLGARRVTPQGPAPPP